VSQPSASRSGPPPGLYVALFLSGAAAILYQLIWQRVLSGLYGTNVESVTIVVAAFMTGLGLGSLAGGWVADRVPARSMYFFVVIEACIGIWGALSVPLFRLVGAATVGTPALLLWPLVGVLLFVPTALMGATLPILVAGVTHDRQPIGPAIGFLSAANTLGSAFGAVATVLAVAGLFGQQGSATLAASLNGAAAVMGWHASRRA
jgi:spermidine synthase